MVTGREIYMTKEGLEELKKKYRHLLDVERPQVIEQLAAARAMGDLSENADYDAARNKQAEIEAAIKEIEYTLNNAVIVEKNVNKNEVGMSSKVKILDMQDNTEMVVQIVSSIESDPLSDPSLLKISNVCPLGEALLGAKVNDVVTVKAASPYQVKIIEIE